MTRYSVYAYISLPVILSASLRRCTRHIRLYQVQVLVLYHCIRAVTIQLSMHVLHGTKCPVFRARLGINVL
jgi:hypothetical protein